jgi:hypothetical protein
LSDRLTQLIGAALPGVAGGWTLMRAVTLDSNSKEDIAMVMMNRAKSGQSINVILLKEQSQNWTGHTLQNINKG